MSLQQAADENDDNLLISPSDNQNKETDDASPTPLKKTSKNPAGKSGSATKTDPAANSSTFSTPPPAKKGKDQPKRELTISDKKSVVRDSDLGISQRSLAKKYNVSKTQIQRILSKKEIVLQSPVENFNRRRFTNLTKFPVLEKKLIEYMIEYNRKYDKNIKKKMLIEKAVEISKRENLKFAASSGWYAGFKARNNIQAKNRKLKRIKLENGVKVEVIEEELLQNPKNDGNETTYEVVVNNVNGYEYEIYVANEEESKDEESIEIIDANVYDDVQAIPTTGESASENHEKTSINTVPELFELPTSSKKYGTKRIKREKSEKPKTRKKRAKKECIFQVDKKEEAEPLLDVPNPLAGVEDTTEDYIIPELMPVPESGRKRIDPPELVDETEPEPVTLYQSRQHQPSALKSYVNSSYSMFQRSESGIKIRVKYEKSNSDSAVRPKFIDLSSSATTDESVLTVPSTSRRARIDSGSFTSTPLQLGTEEQISPAPVQTTPKQPEPQPCQSLIKPQEQKSIALSPLVLQQPQQLQKPQSIEEVIDNGMELNQALSLLTKLRSKLEFRDKKDFHEFYTKISPAIEYLQQMVFKYELEDLRSQLV